MSAGAEHIFVLGDIFGYYPWAVETYNLLEKNPIPKLIIKGNHDEFILQKNRDSTYQVKAEYERAISENLNDLKKNGILGWLNELPETLELSKAGKHYGLFHGTPEDPLFGRFYPDNEKKFPWFPKNETDVLLLGQTHYPLIRKITGGGLILNPGSLGQPRDGNVQSSWLLIDGVEYSLMRTVYDVEKVVSLLKEMNWQESAILALQKKF